MGRDSAGPKPPKSLSHAQFWSLTPLTHPETIPVSRHDPLIDLWEFGERRRDSQATLPHESRPGPSHSQSADPRTFPYPTKHPRAALTLCFWGHRVTSTGLEGTQTPQRSLFSPGGP